MDHECEGEDCWQTVEIEVKVSLSRYVSGTHDKFNALFACSELQDMMNAEIEENIWEQFTEQYADLIDLEWERP